MVSVYDCLSKQLLCCFATPENAAMSNPLPPGDLSAPPPPTKPPAEESSAFSPPSGMRTEASQSQLPARPSKPAQLPMSANPTNTVQETSNPKSSPDASASDTANPAGPTGVHASSKHLSPSSSSSHLPLLPLLNISLIDLLEADPRPTFVVSLVPPATAGGVAECTSDSASLWSFQAPSIVYYNPALTASQALSDIVSAPRSKHAVIWAGLPLTADRLKSPLSPVLYLGLYWTRTILGHQQQYVVISANGTLPATVPAMAGPVQKAPAERTVSLQSAGLEVPIATTAGSREPREPPKSPEPAAPAATARIEQFPKSPSSETSIPLLMQTTKLSSLQPLTSPASALFSPRENDMSSSPSAGTPQLTGWPGTSASAGPGALQTTTSSANNGSSSSSSSSASTNTISREQKKSAVEDRRYMHQFETITENLPVGMCTLDPGGNVVFADDAWFRIMGTLPPAGGTTGSSLFRDQLLALIEEEDQATFVHVFDQTGELTNTTLEFHVKGDRRGPLPDISAPVAAQRGRHVLALANPERDVNNRVVRILLSVCDITVYQSIAEAADRHAQEISNLKRTAEFATVGIYEMDVDGRLRGANRIFFEMCDLEAYAEADLSSEVVQPWPECVVDEDQPHLRACLARLVAEGDRQTVELRFKKPWTTDDGAGNTIVAPRWLEATFLPVKDAVGKVYFITGSLSDVSLRKWQLERERQVKQEAMDFKRQQESFVDMTSHEIRNPLTVIMHCGDAVLESLTKIREIATSQQSKLQDVSFFRDTPQAESGVTCESPSDALPSGSATEFARSKAVTESEVSNSYKRLRTLIDDGIEYAETIVGSALHQKSIVDDILTMSKLDSELLAVTPVTVDPIDIVRSTLKMFELQARLQQISLHMTVAPSYGSLVSRFFTLDPSRVKQILINLLTNALKFTRGVDVREITVNVAASHRRPTDKTCSVSFIPRPASAEFKPAGVQGKSVFLIFEVKDTGEGLTKKGKDLIFQKFVQVNSDIHVKHGGSGLGLFISKRLAEIQNGAIGVASEPGVGSTFAFYIQAGYPPPSSTKPEDAGSLDLGTGLRFMATKAAPDDEGSSAVREEGNMLAPNSPSTTTTTMATATTATTATAATAPTATRENKEAPEGGQSRGVLSDTGSVFGGPTDSAAGSQTGSELRQAAGSTADARRPSVLSSAYSTTSSLTPSLALSSVLSSTLSLGLPSLSPSQPELRGVLLVEDNPVNQKVTQRYFEKAGFEVQVAANGVEAMAKVQQSDRCTAGGFPISVILMDMEMPVQGGLVCTRNIRALEAAGKISGSRIPILMITGNARPEQIADAMAAGCDDVVVKPFQMHLLFDHIKLVMQTLWEDDQRRVVVKESSEKDEENVTRDGKGRDETES